MPYRDKRTWCLLCVFVPLYLRAVETMMEEELDPHGSTLLLCRRRPHWWWYYDLIQYLDNCVNSSTVGVGELRRAVSMTSHPIFIGLVIPELVRVQPPTQRRACGLRVAS
jgi:hypothetical protein